MDYSPLLSKKVDVSKLSYLPPKKNTNGGKSVLVSYAGEPLVIQLPVMYIPYGLTDAANIVIDKNAKKTDKLPSRYVIDLSFRGKEEDKPLNNAFEKLQEIETRIKKDAFANRVSWMNDRFDDMEPLVNKMFSSNMRFDKDKETGKILNRYPPTFRVKLPYKNETDTFEFDSYDMDQNELAFKDIKDNLKGAKTRMIIQLAGLWFAGGKYGCTWKLLSGSFQQKMKKHVVYVVDSDEEDAPPAKKGASKHLIEDDEDLEDDVAAATASVTQKLANTVISESEEEEEEDEPEPEEEDEEEDDEEEEREPTPPPPPPPKKKVAAVKKTLKV